MPLQPQVIDIDMGLGLDTFTDPKRVVPGKFTTLENARFVRGKRLEMRRGNVAYGGTYKLGNTGSASDSYGSFSNRLHVKRTKTLNDSPVFWGEYQRAAGTGQLSGNRWVSSYRDSQTQLQRLLVTPAYSPDAALVNTLRVQDHTRSLLNSATSVAMVDSCMMGQFVVTLWSETDGTNFNYFYDVRAVDGAIVQTKTNIMSTTLGSGWCKAITVSSTRCWLVVPNNSLTSVRIAICNSTDFSVNVANYAVASLKLDAVVLGSDVFVLGHDFDGGTGAVVKSGLVSWSTPGTFTAKNAYALGAVTLQSMAIAAPKPASTKLRIFWTDTTNGTRGVSLTASTGATVTGPTTLSAYTNPAFRMAAVELGDEYLWIIRSDNDATYDELNRSQVITVREAGTFTGATASFIKGLLCSSILPNRTTDTASFFLQSHNTKKTESAYFQYQIQCATVVVSAKVLSGRAIPYSKTLHGVGSFYNLSATQDRVALLDSYKIYNNSAASTLFLTGISTITATNDYRAPLASADTSGVMVLGGGVLGQWDGQQVSHCGFLGRPTIYTTTNASVGGAMSNGTYSLVAVLEWIDGQGNTHLSAPSDPVSVTLTGGTATQKISTFVEYPFPYVGTTPTDNGLPRCYIYSTTNGGTAYRRANDTPSVSATPQRVCSDTDLLTREVLYTTGSVLPNAMPDGPPVVGLFNDRVLASSPNEDDVLYAQKPPSIGYGPEFSDQLTVGISAKGGPVTAIVENVDKCCVFKKRSIQVFTGEGYTATGEGGYSNAETIYEHLGCPGPWAATSTPVGVMFDTGGQGIWLLGRDLQLSYVGEGVDSWKDTEVYSVSVVPNEQEVRWLMASGEILAYNWTASAWSVFTPFPCWDIGLANGVPIYLRQSTSNLGGVYTDSDTAFTDMMSGVIDVSAANITMQAVTGWMNFAGLQGYQRVWRALFTGDYSDIHTLLVDVGYDYKPTYADAFSLASANIMAGSSVYDGQVTLHQSFSKSVRLKLRASSSAGDTTGPMSLTGLSFEVGILPRGARMPSTKGA